MSVANTNERYFIACARCTLSTTAVYKSNVLNLVTWEPWEVFSSFNALDINMNCLYVVSNPSAIAFAFIQEMLSVHCIKYRITLDNVLTCTEHP